jgi:hypothetical protein
MAASVYTCSAGPGSSRGRRGYQARSPRPAESGRGSSATRGNPARFVRDEGDRSSARRHGPACSRRSPDAYPHDRALERRRATGDGSPRIGHEYVWTEWNRARQHADQERLKELEFVVTRLQLSHCANSEWIHPRRSTPSKKSRDATGNDSGGCQREELSNARGTPGYEDTSYLCTHTSTHASTAPAVAILPTMMSALPSALTSPTVSVG